ncbi:MAG: hypothetical protein AAF810_08150 [Cyanobacteria bacterium P01_D01_bin.36]
MVLILTVLTSCGMISQMPPDRTVWLAITQQQIDMQTSVAKSLDLATQVEPIPDFKVGRVAIESREKLLDSALKKQAVANGAYIDGLYKVVGTYDATLTKGDESITQNNPFEVYLGNRPKSMRSTVSAAEAAETWFLLSPESATPLK